MGAIRADGPDGQVATRQADARVAPESSGARAVASSRRCSSVPNVCRGCGGNGFSTRWPPRLTSAEKGVTPAQLAIAWLLVQGDDIVPIPGTKRRTYLEQNAAAVDVDLATDELARIDAELPTTAGERYDQVGMASVNR